MFYVSDTLLVEVTLLTVTLRREDGRILTVTIDVDGTPNTVLDNTGYRLGVEELTKEERSILKRLVDID